MSSNKVFDKNFRSSILLVSKPIFFVAETPFNLLFDFGQGVKNLVFTNLINKDLVTKNRHLKNLYIKSMDIKAENENLKKLLNFKDEIEGEYNYLASRVYSNTKNGLINSINVNIGTDEGVKEGDLVLGVSKSVVGRIINVKDGYSNILLLNDINSRIPARTASNKERIILSGNNNGYLEISYFNSKNPKLIDGDLVFTSGDPNIIPDGFFIGKVKKIDNNFIVEMNEDVGSLFNVLIITPKEFLVNSDVL